MTTDRSDPEAATPLAEEGGPGERLRRLHRRRRLLREELIAVGFLLVALAATVAVLANQWLGSGPSTNALGLSHPTLIPTLLGGPFYMNHLAGQLR
jgi:hypothetical protein